MKAMLSTQPGSPDSLALTEQEDKSPGAGEVAIRIHAAGVNFPDLLIIADMYQFKPERPFAPGGEVSGVVESVGEGVDNLKEGDRVLAMMLNGGYATRAVVPANTAIKIPDNMPFDEAAGFLLTYGTTRHGLAQRGDLKEGETLFILGATGGVGSAAIELGKAMGAKVVAGVSSEEKAKIAKEFGADETLVYPKGELDRDAQKAFSAAIKEACGGEGPDVIYDPVGGDYAEPAFRSINWKGRYLVIGFPAGIPKIPLNLPLLKGADLVGVFWGAHTGREPEAHKENLKALFQLYSEGKIRPRISQTYKLEDAGKALQALADRTATGKLVLDCT